MTSMALAPRVSSQSRSRTPLLDTLLVILVLGPIASPLLQASAVPALRDLGWLARDLLSTYICPTPAASYMLAGYPMGVCARCWGAALGLGLAWKSLPALISLNRLGQQQHWYSSIVTFIQAYKRLPWIARFVLCALPFVFWPLEIHATAQGWQPPLWLLLVNGLQAGFAAGLFFYALYPGFANRQDTSTQ